MAEATPDPLALPPTVQAVLAARIGENPEILICA
jgi:hypothetical protein